MASRDRTHLVGVDCSTSAKLVGLARGVIEGTRLSIEGFAAERTWDDVDGRLAAWLEVPSLVAIDAPLGWPRPLGDTLAGHRAGDTLRTEAHALFRRFTDDVVANEIGKRSLDVGADRIARTAHAALAMLGRLRVRLDDALPLVWVPGPVRASGAIEVYPAATLAGRGWPSIGYKGDKPGSADVRAAIVDRLATEASFDDAARLAMIASDHTLDAALCVLAGADFVRGEVIAPTDRQTVEREGWIWVRPSLASIGA